MQSTADFCHHIANTVLKHADRVFGDATALHATIYMFDPHPTPRNLLIFSLLFFGQTATSRLFRRHDDFDPIQAKAHKPEILHQSTAAWQSIPCAIGNPLIVDAAFVGIAQEHDQERSINQQQVFDAMILFLTTIEAV